MDVSAPAFATPLSTRLLVGTRSPCVCERACTRRVSLSRRVASLRMTASPPEPEQAAEDDEVATRSATEILRTLREDSANDEDPNAGQGMLGVYRDVDGRSNVWAVEPLEETDTRPQLSKTTIIAGAAAFIVIALLVLPLLPFTNPDQL